MPKKFKGENSKAAVAKERKSAVRDVVEREKKQKEDDEYWRDDDKQAAKKQGKKEDRERKKQEQLERKQESKLLLEQEEADLVGKVKALKPTRAQINQAEEEKKRLLESESAAALPRGVVVITPSLEENPNHILRERLERGESDARTVEEAIDVLRGPNDRVDMNPEKRVKAAYTAFEERELPRLKAENPSMKLSQIKQLLRKEWMKSADNPLNSQ